MPQPQPWRETGGSRLWIGACTLWVLGLCAVRACRPLAGGVDFWAHASIGRWILEHHRVPQQTLWIWGAAPQHWIAHSWGSQVIFALLMRAGEVRGAGLAIVLSMACGAASFGLLWRANIQSLRSHGLRPDLPLLALYALAVMCAGVRFKPRPELFTAMFVTAQLLFWLDWQREARAHELPRPRGLPSRTCLSLVAMWVLWANVHGAWAFGVALWGLTVAGDGLQDRFDARWRRLLVVGACCVLATLLNPYGAQVWQSLQATHSTTFSYIEEWKKPWAWPSVPPEWIWGEVILAAGALAAWIYDPKRRWSHALWIAFALLSFCLARRFLWLSALVQMAVLAHSGWALQRSWWLAMRRHVPIRLALDGGSLALMAAVLAHQTPHDILRTRALSVGVPVRLSQRARLIEAQMARRGQKMRPFNDYEYSSYFQWAFAGRPPLYIDLLNAYPDRLMDDYFAILHQNARGKSQLARANAVISRTAGKGEEVLKFQQALDKQPKIWKRVYKGRDGIMWLRR